MPTRSSTRRGGGSDALLERVTNRLRDQAGAIDGALIEPKKALVAVRCRLVSDGERLRIKAPSMDCSPSIPVS
jgi:hypothetical protein